MHHHSGLGLLTPADVHHGLAEQRVAARASVLAAAHAAHPERFPAGPPQPPALPVEVWINPPKTRATEETRGLATLAAVSLTARDSGSLSRPTVPTLTDEAAWRLRHEVSPVPAGQPAPRQVLPGLRSPPRAHLRFLWRRPTRGRSLLPPVRPSCHRWHGGPGVGSPAPETYTPKHLAEKILTSKAALEGERKQVTVLFADLKGSMELLADRDPEEARKLLDPVLERMMEAVHRYEGTVNQVMGDGIMALFGAPLAHEDHAVRACYAALRMQESCSLTPMTSAAPRA